MINLSSKQLGTITEYECAIAIMKEGCRVSIPLGENSPYDLIADIGNKLYKIQCKHSRPVSGGFEFSCECTRINATSIKVVHYEDSEVDYFATMFNNTCYLVPKTLCGSVCKLRAEPTKNNQAASINWADRFDAHAVISTILESTNQ